ncbi:MAG: hypothetical protein ACIARQ_16670 [Phycisphaerales bacterium JB061]
MIETLKKLVHTSRPGASKSALLIAIGVSLILVSFILIISSRSGPKQRSALDDIDLDQVPDLMSAPEGDIPSIDQPGSLSDLSDGTITLKDKDDPTRIAWDIRFARLNPVSGTDTVEMEKPRAWYLLGDDSLVFIRSDTAEFLTSNFPDSEPESGRFSGNVEVLQFARNEDGSLPEPVASGSSVRITTNWLDFDSVGSELSTSEIVQITSESIDADCEGLRVVFNEVDERVELLEIPGTLVATIRPGQSGSSNQPQEDPGTEGAPPTTDVADAEPPHPGIQPAKQPEPEPINEQFYAVTFEGSVHVEQPARQIDADRARVWIRLVDNQIPETTQLGIQPKLKDPVGLNAALVSMVLASSAQPEFPTSRDLGLYEDVLFKCAGPTVVRPMLERPAALGSGDDVALRFESEPNGVVTFTDSVLLAAGEASAIEYGFTNNILALTGYDGHPTTINVEESGSIIGESLTIGLTTGIGQASGAGVLTEADTGRSLSWSEQADVVFRTEEGWVTGSIEQAIATGAIELTDTDARVTADSINTRFAKGEDPLLERAVLTGSVVAKTTEGELSADRVDVRFDTSTGDAVPVLATASGNVRGSQDGATISAGIFEADIESDTDGNLRVSVARASESVRFDREDGAFAEGDVLRAELDREYVMVEGVPAIVGANDASVAARSITLDGSSRSIRVPGAGEFTLKDEEGLLTIATAKWTDSMSYTDESGELEAVGNVVAVSTPNALSEDRLKGDRLFALVMPADGSTSLDDRSDRQLISATVTAEAEHGASVVVSRYANVGDNAPAQIINLDSTLIEIDNIGGILSVPAPGRLLVSDREMDTNATDSSTLNGSALFEWQGQLLFDRPTGTVDMSSRVTMIHLPSGDGSDVELECENLIASFTESDEASELVAGADTSQLENVNASGAVWARTGQQQILADMLTYVAETQSATATAEGGGWVTLFDPTQAAPVTAAELLWSLDTGRIEVVRPNPVSLPR